AAPVPPVLPEKPIEGNWLGGSVTAFPNVKGDYPLDLVKGCPKLFGKDAIAIEATDDTYRRLLKARLHQGAQFVWKLNVTLQTQPDWVIMFPLYIGGQDDMRAVIVELWANDPKNLIPRLEELVIVAKDA